ncbi:uncharacterized protein TM35_000312290 [Trypanosoma theileri]|uniref:Transmembrane protein n=1 Tax=Trypanosoma theileri TaxID=67003 RepID=A0A1X0NNG1_9TRYP|nr:uncharacterized protein TM35_000312290 [Trypanosoma theileri]ORC86043.1 hypothetical protein TM35_000312290 [Trypanosoma theileri]
MLRFARVSFLVVGAVSVPSSGIQRRGISDEPLHVSPQSAQVLHSLYRRLRKEGETRDMMERALSVHSLEVSIRLGLRLLHYHTMLVNADREAHEVASWRILRRIRIAAVRRYFAWRIFIIRLRLRSTAAISDALVYSLFMITCFMLYQIYRVCRIGVSRAEERYRTMAIPIKQTFDSLELAQQRRLELRREMEEDLVRQR